jgi:hypothetical protein
VVSVILLVAWLGSGWLHIGWGDRSGIGVALHRGALGLSSQSRWSPDAEGLGLAVYRIDRPLVWRPDWNQLPTGWYCVCPLWPAVGLSILVTALAWRLDTLSRRRARVGFCLKCHYSRVGLAPGAVCPECGAAEEQGVHR